MRKRIIAATLFLLIASTVYATNAKKVVVNINNATQAQLQFLPGVGEKTAKAIIEKRPYKKLEDIKQVKGIKEKRFERIKPFITLQGDTTATEKIKVQ